MTNEQNAIQLEGYLVELNSAIAGVKYETASDSERPLIDLAVRIKCDIDLLRGDRGHIFPKVP